MDVRIERYPLDFDSLTKGSTIPEDTLNYIVGMKREENPDRWDMKVLQLKSVIEMHRQDLVVRRIQNSLRVLTDVEAEEYLQRRFDGHERNMMKAHARRQLIDRSQFTETERRAAEHRDVVNASKVVAMIQAAKRAKMLLKEGEDT